MNKNLLFASLVSLMIASSSVIAAPRERCGCSGGGAVPRPTATPKPTPPPQPTTAKPSPAARPQAQAAAVTKPTRVNQAAPRPPRGVQATNRQ